MWVALSNTAMSSVIRLSWQYSESTSSCCPHSWHMALEFLPWLDHVMHWEHMSVVPQGSLTELQVAAGVVGVVLIISELGPAACALLTAAEVVWEFFSCFCLSWDFSISSALWTAAGGVKRTAHWHCSAGKSMSTAFRQCCLLKSTMLQNHRDARDWTGLYTRCRWTYGLRCP